MEDLIALLGGFFLLFGLVGIVLYVLGALGLSRMAKKLGVENPWMAWLPIFNIYLIGKIAGDEVVVFGKEVKNLAVVLAVSSVVIGAVSVIPLIGQIALIVYIIFYYTVLNKIYKIFNESSARMYTVLSVIFAPLLPVFLFIMSGKEPNVSGGDNDEIEF